MWEVRRVFPLVGDKVEALLFVESEELARNARPLLDGLESEARRLEKIFNLYDPGSELSRLNRARRLAASPELSRVLSMALAWGRRTDGAYDVSRGKTFLARKRGVPEELLSCSFLDVHIEGNEIILGHPDALVDLGSIAKGALVDFLFDWLAGQGIADGFIDARGDMRIRGRHVERLEIQDPRGLGTLGPVIHMENLAVATSGDYRQYQGDFARSHLVGKQSTCSATVMGPTLAEADALATCAMVLPKADAVNLIKSVNDIGAILVDEDGVVTKVGKTRPYLI